MSGPTCSTFMQQGDTVQDTDNTISATSEHMVQQLKPALLTRTEVPSYLHQHQQPSPRQVLDTPQQADQPQQLQAELLLQGLLASRSRRQSSADGTSSSTFPASSAVTGRPQHCAGSKAVPVLQLPKLLQPQQQQQEQQHLQQFMAAAMQASCSAAAVSATALPGSMPLQQCPSSLTPLTSIGSTWPTSVAVVTAVAAQPHMALAADPPHVQQQNLLHLLPHGSSFGVSAAAAATANMHPSLMAALSVRHQQQENAVQQQEAPVQQQHDRPMLQLQSTALPTSNSSAFAVAVGAVPSTVGNSGAGANLTSERSGSVVIGRTITGELPVMPTGLDQATAASAATALASTSHAAAAMVDGRPEAGEQQEELKVLRHTRQLTCKTYLKRLNVTQFMSDHLLPCMEGSLRTSSQKLQAGLARAAAAQQRSSSCRVHAAGSRGVASGFSNGHSVAGGSDEDYEPRTAAGHSSSNAGGSRGHGQQRTYEMLFKVQVKLVDAVGQLWPVTYEGVMCAGQRHLRLTCGWSEFIKARNLAIGDSITFERRGENRTTLAVAVQRAGQEAEVPWAGKLPEDEQIKVLVGSVREQESNVISCLDSTAHTAVASSRSTLDYVAPVHTGGGCNVAAAPATSKQRGKHQQLPKRVPLKKKQTSVKKRGRGCKNDAYADEQVQDYDNDEDSSGGSTAQTESSSGFTTAITTAAAAIGTVPIPASPYGELKEGFTALRVCSTEPTPLDSSAVAQLLRRPRSFTKRQNTTTQGLEPGRAADECPDGAQKLSLASFNSEPVVGRSVTPAVDMAWLQQPQPAPQQQQQHRQQQVLQESSPWAQQQKQWHDQEQQLQWQHPQPAQVLASWNTYPAGPIATVAAPAPPMAAAVEANPTGSRRFMRQVSHPVARREYLAAQQDVTAAPSSNAGPQQAHRLPLPSGTAGVIMEGAQYGAAAAGMNARNHFAKHDSVNSSHQLYSSELDDLLRAAVSVPVTGGLGAALASRFSAAAAEGPVAAPGWQVSTGFNNTSSGPCGSIAYSSQQQQYGLHTQFLSAHNTAVDANISPTAAAAANCGACACGGRAGGTRAAAMPGHQQQQRCNPSVAAADDLGPFGSSTASISYASHQQQFGSAGLSSFLAPPQSHHVMQSPAQRPQVLKIEHMFSEQHAWQQPQHWQQQLQHQSQLAGSINAAGLPVTAPPPCSQPSGLLSYTRSIQMDDADAADLQPSVPIRQQEQLQYSQPMALQPQIGQQQQRRQDSAPAAVTDAAGWDVGVAEPNPFLQHQQQERFDAPDADQISVGAMESDTLVDTLLQLLAEPSVNMSQAPSLSQEQQKMLKSETEEQQQSMQKELQQAEKLEQGNLVQEGTQTAQQAQWQQQWHERGQPDEMQQWRQQQVQHSQALLQQQAAEKQQASVPARVQTQKQVPTLLQQWQQRKQARPSLAPPKLLPLEVVAAAANCIELQGSALSLGLGHARQ